MIERDETDEIELTEHGENIGDQIPGEDAYGHSGTLNAADVYYILDMLHTNVMNDDDWMQRALSDFMRKIAKHYPNIEY